ncbi:MAG: ADP-ribosylglycohydrolase family protein [Bacilli bacterium]
MKIINDDYFVKLYAGWLGMLIGIRYGAPVEMWTSEQIKEKYPDTDGYFVDYPIFGADDDSNGPIFFLKTLDDIEDVNNLTPEDFGNTWLNYVPYLHGFFWWGGYRVSTEHTAYINLRKGIKAPESGSINVNTKVVAEQIGGQIFSDVWGLVCPNDFKKAASLAKMASQVSHDGEGVNGGMFIAACVSSAFKAKSVKEIINDGLSVLSENSEYYKMAVDIIDYYKNNSNDPEGCFNYIRSNYWIDKYPGHCHIIPNAAIIVYSLLYGEGDFEKTLKITNYSGFDTDCNVGNIGTIMGVYCGLEAIDYEKWIKPINDIILCSSTIVHENIVDIPSLVYRTARLALKLFGEEYTGKYSKSLQKEHLSFDFLLLGSTHGFRSSNPSVKMENKDGKLHLSNINDKTHIFYKSYYAKEDLYDNRYDTAIAPVVLPGQTIKVRCNAEKETKVALFYKDIHTSERIYFSPKEIKGKAELSFKMDKVVDALISEVGIYFESGTTDFEIEHFEIVGSPSYVLDFQKEIIEDYSPTHYEVRGTKIWNGKWGLENGNLTCISEDMHAEIYAGIKMKDFTLKSEFSLEKGKAGVLFRVQGASRSYGAFIDGKNLTLEKNNYGYQVLKQVSLPIAFGDKVEIEVILEANRILVFANGTKMIDYLDEKPYLEGCFGAYLSENSQATFRGFKINQRGE